MYVYIERERDRESEIHIYIYIYIIHICVYMYMYSYIYIYIHTHMMGVPSVSAVFRFVVSPFWNRTRSIRFPAFRFAAWDNAAFFEEYAYI